MEKRDLRTWRRLRNMSQDKLADKADISRTTLFNYEQNGLASASIYTLTALLRALDIEFDQLDLKL